MAGNNVPVPVAIQDVPPVCLLTALMTAVLAVIDVTTDPNAVCRVIEPLMTRAASGSPIRLVEGEMVTFITTPGVLHRVPL